MSDHFDTENEHLRDVPEDSDSRILPVMFYLSEKRRHFLEKGVEYHGTGDACCLVYM